jgi:hypothetical protein
VAKKNVKQKRPWLSLSLTGLLLVGILIWQISNPSSQWVEETYSRRVYQSIAGFLVPITNSVGFSVSAVLLVALPLIWIAWTVQRFRKGQFLKWLRRTMFFATLLYTLFLVTWGANYQRESIEAQLNLDTTSLSETDLQVFISTLSDIIQENVNARRDVAKAQTSLHASLLETTETITGVKPTLPAWVKTLPPGSLIRSGNAAGVISPFTLEPHLDSALHEPYALAVGTHELAHIAGYAGEADTDFVAALAGLSADDPYAQYAVALKLWNDAVLQLPEDERHAAVHALPERARADLEATYAVFRRYRLPAWIQNLQTGLYNRYLTSQGVEEGVRDYSRTTTLLLAAQRQGFF